MNGMLGARFGLVLGLGLVHLGCSGDGGHGACQNYSALEVPEPLWINVTPAVEGPVARRGHAGAYDAVGDRLIVHGGRNKSGQVLGDTWLLLHASAASIAPTWAEVEPATGPVAPALQGAVAGYHPASDTFLLVGGIDEGGTTTMDVWRLAPAGGPAALWSRATPGGTPPPVRAEMAAAYDPASDSLYLFGGRAADGTGLLNDTWVLKSATDSPVWTKLEPQGELPDPRAAAAVVYDPAQQTLTLYGGSAASQSPGEWSQELHDTLVLKNTALPGSGALWGWSELITVGHSPKGAHHSLVLDPDRHRAVRFGGLRAPGTRVAETGALLLHEERHAEWSVIQAGVPRPSPRSQHLAGFSPSSHRMIVYGGVLVEDQGQGVVRETELTGEVWVLRNASGFEGREMASLTILAPSKVLCVGNTMQLTPKLLGRDGEILDGVAFEWSVEEDKVEMNSPVNSEVPGGLITGMAAGKEKIFAQPPGSTLKGQTEITVEPAASGPSQDGGGGGRCAAVATCCTTRGGIQVYGITCPTGTCPPGTFVVHDSRYDVDQCSCDC